MKKLMALILFFFVTQVYATTLNCSTSINTELIGSSQFEIETGEQVTYESYDGFQLMVNKHSDVDYELEIYNPYIPSRSYAGGILKNFDDKLSWSYWTRDILIGTVCTL